VGCVAEILCSAGMIALTAFVSPYRKDRNQVRSLVNAARDDRNFVEVFVDTPIEICEARDPKGLYRKARAGEITGFTGVDDPYEEPDNPEIRLDGSQPVERSTEIVLEYLRSIRKIS
jgi:adenylylsulfate kinase